ncbi:acyl carrier protein [Plantactinospora sp. WMMB334]|uniref:acyl carrier protein n=1 Tax=Plantactinospora sp. WMMB334 TaxID=3404119 RepID=UPI003B92FC7A
MTSLVVPDREELRARVRAALRGRLGPAVDDVADDVPLPEALGARYDSLAALECITLVEAEFEVEVDFVEHDVRYAFATVERIVQFVHDRLEDRVALGTAR